MVSAWVDDLVLFVCNQWRKSASQPIGAPLISDRTKCRGAFPGIDKYFFPTAACGHRRGFIFDWVSAEAGRTTHHVSLCGFMLTCTPMQRHARNFGETVPVLLLFRCPGCPWCWLDSLLSHCPRNEEGNHTPLPKWGKTDRGSSIRELADALTSSIVDFAIRDGESFAGPGVSNLPQ